MWLKSLQELGFAGNIYLVNPKLNEFMGMKVYPSIKEIPDSINLVEEQGRFIRAGLPVYSSLASAAQAISKLIQYQDYRSSLTAMGQAT